jgi:hypothetical protein
VTALPFAQEKTAMMYKTIVLELLQEQYPVLHEQLRRERMLLKTLELYATELRTAHLAWMEAIRRASPDFDPSQLSIEALELALEHLQGSLPSESPPTDAAEETFSLDAAMAHLLSHTPPA